eukprot:3185235-Amphidinium_carterae.1
MKPVPESTVQKAASNNGAAVGRTRRRMILPMLHRHRSGKSTEISPPHAQDIPDMQRCCWQERLKCVPER